MKEIAENLKKLREQQQLDQAIVAGKMGYEFASSLSHVEAGRKQVSSQVLVLWLNSLGINLNTIILDALAGVDFELIHQATQKNLNVNQIIEQEINKVNQ